MYVIDLTLEISEHEYDKIKDVLLNACDNDTVVGIRVKDVAGTPSNVLAAQALCRVLALQPGDHNA